MRSEVPKFIEVEDKIVGQFTWKQFLYLCGGIGAVLIAQHFIKNLFWAIIVTSPIIAVVLALVFYKVNGQNFSIILQAAVGYYFRQKLYKWRVTKPTLDKTTPKKIDVGQSVDEVKAKQKEADKAERISDVSWGLDVLDR